MRKNVNTWKIVVQARENNSLLLRVNRKPSKPVENKIKTVIKKITKLSKSVFSRASRCFILLLLLLKKVLTDK